MKDAVGNQRKIELFNESAVFKGLSAKAQQELSSMAVLIYGKSKIPAPKQGFGTIISQSVRR